MAIFSRVLLAAFAVLSALVCVSGEYRTSTAFGAVGDLRTALPRGVEVPPRSFPSALSRACPSMGFALPLHFVLSPIGPLSLSVYRPANSWGAYRRASTLAFPRLRSRAGGRERDGLFEGGGAGGEREGGGERHSSLSQASSSSSPPSLLPLAPGKRWPALPALGSARPSRDVHAPACAAPERAPLTRARSCFFVA